MTGKPKGYSKGKAVKAETLPSRHARSTVAGGDPVKRMMNNYGKKDSSSPQMGLNLMGLLGRGF